MGKNKIKSFAVWVRRSLIAAVSEKVNRIKHKPFLFRDGLCLFGKGDNFKVNN